MRIAFFSHKFAPDVGGIESTSMLLAREFVHRGHQVTLVTSTERETPEGDDSLPFRVLRAPSPRQLVSAVRWSEVVYHNNPCAQFVWPLLVHRRPWVVSIRTWIARIDGSVSAKDRVKRWMLRFATVISISRAIADHLKVQSVVIPNAYRDDVFREREGVERRHDSLVFVGRLVSDKGADQLLEALVRLRGRGLKPPLAIIGSGEQEPELREFVERNALGDQVSFLGQLQGRPLVDELNGHGVIVVPSVWNEPFGIVALEGIASGCIAVASRGGGLGDAVGECGLTYRNGDVDALTEALARVLSDDDLRAKLAAARPRHLARHTQARMADAYMQVIETAGRRRRVQVE